MQLLDIIAKMFSINSSAEILKLGLFQGLALISESTAVLPSLNKFQTRAMQE